MLSPGCALASPPRLDDIVACHPPDDDGVFERQTERCLLQFTDRGAKQEAIVRIASKDVVVRRVRASEGYGFQKIALRSANGAVEVELDVRSDEAEAEAQGREYVLHWGTLTVRANKLKRSYKVDFVRGG
jgi:hypothetical protein